MDSLLDCKKSCVRYLALLVRDDRRTHTGREISATAKDSGSYRRTGQTFAVRAIDIRCPNIVWEMPQ